MSQIDGLHTVCKEIFEKLIPIPFIYNLISYCARQYLKPQQKAFGQEIQTVKF